MSDLTPSPRIEWRVEFETGNPAIDHEHKQMIDRINGFLASADAGLATEIVVGQLGEIYAWISVHFALEEKIMRDHRYDQFDQHKADHEALLDNLCDFMDEIAANGYAAAEQKIQQRLTDWFVDHFKTQDSRLHRGLI